MCITEMENLLKDNEIRFEEIERGVYDFYIPFKFSEIIERNLGTYGLKYFVVGAVAKTRFGEDGINYLNAPVPSVDFKNLDDGYRVRFEGAFKTGYFFIERFLKAA